MSGRRRKTKAKGKSKSKARADASAAEAAEAEIAQIDVDTIDLSRPLPDAAHARALARSFIERIRQLDSEPWPDKRRGDGELFAAKKQSESSPFVLVRGHRVIDAPPRDVWTFVKGVDNIATIDQMCKNGSPRCVQRFADDLGIYYSQFKMPTPLITDRDFVWLELDSELDDGTFVCASKSVVHDDAPPDSGHVRGEIVDTGYVCKPAVIDGVADHTKTDLSYIVCCDPKGWLPVAVVNLVALDQADNVSSVAKLLEAKKTADD